MTQRKVAAARLHLRTDALIAYMGGVPLTDITAVPFSSSNDAAATSEYQQVAIANTAAVAAAYEAGRARSPPRTRPWWRPRPRYRPS